MGGRHNPKVEGGREGRAGGTRREGAEAEWWERAAGGVCGEKRGGKGLGTRDEGMDAVYPERGFLPRRDAGSTSEGGRDGEGSEGEGEGGGERG